MRFFAFMLALSFFALVFWLVGWSKSTFGSYYGELYFIVFLAIIVLTPLIILFRSYLKVIRKEYKEEVKAKANIKK